MKRAFLTLAALALLFGSVGLASAGEIPITVTGFDEQMVVGGGSPAVTATMDGGAFLNGYTWYAKGYNTSAPNTGLVSGVQTSISSPTTSLLLAPFTSNDTLLVDSNHSGSLVITTPGKYSTLSFFASTGSGDATINYTLHFADSSTSTGTFAAPDWFFNGPVAVGANGRVDLSNNFDHVNTDPPYPAIYQEDIGNISSSSALTSIDFSQAGGGGHTAIWAVSGSEALDPSAVPEPATVTMLGIGLAGLAGYGVRRRKQRAASA